MDAAYNVWKWYTANMLHVFYGSMWKGDAVARLALLVADDLRTLVDDGGADMDWMERLEEICEGAFALAEAMLRSSSKTWITWTPEDNCQALYGFPVSSTTDEGSGVLIEVWEGSCYPRFEEPEVLDGQVVQLVVRPALAQTVFYESDLKHHYAAPMAVIVAEHLSEDESPDSEDESLDSEDEPPEEWMYRL